MKLHFPNFFSPLLVEEREGIAELQLRERKLSLDKI